MSDFVGMLGLPLVPCHTFPDDAQAAFFSLHALHDPRFAERFSAYIGSGKPVLLTDGLAKRLTGKVALDSPSVHILPVKGDPKSLLRLPKGDLERIREPLLRPLGRRFVAAGKLALYLWEDGSSVIENFNDEPAIVELDGLAETVPARGWIQHWK